MVSRIYVEKKPGLDVKGKAVLDDLTGYLEISSVTKVRTLVRYDVENISEEALSMALKGVFYEPPVDLLYREDFPKEDTDFVFGTEYLPGQFDQRADSAVQCISFLKADEMPTIRTATVYVIEGSLTEEEKERIKKHLINPVDSREASMEKPETLKLDEAAAESVPVIEGFRDMCDEDFDALYTSLSLAMTKADFDHIRTYFREDAQRDPTMTEIRVLDTYWSDHCRHTTFSTEFTDVAFDDGDYRPMLEEAFKSYLETHKEMYGDRDDKFVCLMDMALMAARKLKKDGIMTDQEESDEINACSIVVPLVVDGKEEEWLINFKNETHNHPTEIEPFGGAATCLGGAIRDPLSGRTYVYQAMRVTGAADPKAPLEETLPGKLPQKKIVTEAARGYSSYGNQIGLATGQVREFYHPGYVAKRMEIGAVLGAAPRRAVKRLSSDPGNVIILLGGRTGRDGCGGATGSSKSHTKESLSSCGAEVQKGNAPTERKIQRLFRREEVTRLIRKCNDFGAGGVSVAIGELADGIYVNLDKVPLKYRGLNGTEIAISESQERMAVVVDKKDEEAFLKYADEENLEAVTVGSVTEEPRLVLALKGRKIVDLKRSFLDTNGAHQEAGLRFESPKKDACILKADKIENVEQSFKNTLSDLNVCSGQGLSEMFDASIGAGTALMPFGGKYQKTEPCAMAAKVPVGNHTCDAVTLMSYGFDPYISSWSPYHGAALAVTESVAKIAATGGDVSKVHFTFQEYFEKMTGEPEKFGRPASALLGAYKAQMGFGLASIGGKDSMSGNFGDKHVPPTLVSFAVGMAKSGDLITPEFKKAGSHLILIEIPFDAYGIPEYEKAKEIYKTLHKDMQAGRVLSAMALDRKGLAAALPKMAFGNGLGFKISDITKEEFFMAKTGGIVIETEDEGALLSQGKCIGEVTDDGKIAAFDMVMSVKDALEIYEAPLQEIYPIKAEGRGEKLPDRLYKEKNIHICKNKVARPKVFIPVLPGTNCEYDSAAAFEKAGACADVKVFRNQSPLAIESSMSMFEKAIRDSQIVMFPGGFSAGDEPDGSAKFFASAFKNPLLKEALEDLLNERDGLVLGICNGFQTLVKLGLLPGGHVTGQNEQSPTLTYNTIGRHISRMAYTKVTSKKSPWLQMAELGKTYVTPVSHGEGRFVAPEDVLEKLFENGQVATRYADFEGNISMDPEININGSYGAVEGITSPDGRVFGKMAHVERRGDGVALNVYGEQDLHIFESGVKYFK